MPKPAQQIQRVLLAVFATTFLIVGAVLANTSILDSGSREYVSGTLMKVGFVLGMTWLAAPALERMGWEKIRGSLLVAVIVVIVLMAIRPRIGAMAGMVLGIGCGVVAIGGWVRQLTQPPHKQPGRASRKTSKPKRLK